MFFLSLVFGLIVGFSLGLTGGGGSIFAVPLLVYGLSVEPRDAVGISLAAVGMTALVGTVVSMRSQQVEIRTGLVFAIAGMLGAPFGSWLAGRISPSLLLLLFATLMIVIAIRMWRRTMSRKGERQKAEPSAGDVDLTNCQQDSSACRRDSEGHLLKMSSRCVIFLSLLGLITGVLSGLFGVGGGFVIVPALVMFSGMSVHQAIGTSLFVIALVSVSGVSSHLLGGGSISAELTMGFVLGGVIGMLAGNVAGRHLSGPALQRGFAIAMLCVALFMAVRTIGETL